MKKHRTVLVLLSALLAKNGITTAFTTRTVMPCPKSRDTTTTTSTSTTTTQIFSVFGNNYLTSLEQQNMMMDPTTNQAAAMDTTRSNAYTAPLQKQQTYQPQQTHDEEYVRPISTDFDSFDGPPVPTTDPKQLMAKIKEKGTAGIISFAMVQTGFWSLSFAVALAAYVEVTGHLPNFSDPEEMSQLGTEAFAYVNVARLAAPLRFAAAMSGSSWVQENVLDRFGIAGGKENEQQMLLEEYNSEGYYNPETGDYEPEVLDEHYYNYATEEYYESEEDEYYYNYATEEHYDD